MPCYLAALVGGGAAENCHQVAANARRNRCIVEISAGNVIVESCDVADGALLVYSGAFTAAVEILAPNDNLSAVLRFEHSLEPNIRFLIPSG